MSDLKQKLLEAIEKLPEEYHFSVLLYVEYLLYKQNQSQTVENTSVKER